MTTKDNGWRERFSKQMFISMKLEKGEIKGFNMDELCDFLEQEIKEAEIRARKDLLRDMRSYLKRQGEGWDDGKTMYLINQFKEQLK